MNDREPSEHRSISATEAQRLLDSVPQRPRRVFERRDHLSAAVTVVLAFVAGLLALRGLPWWATLPALGAIVTSHMWISRRLSRPNEPRVRGGFISTAFTVWVLIPVWRGIVHGETIPVPEAVIVAGMAPAAWLIFYTVLLLRR